MYNLYGISLEFVVPKKKCEYNNSLSPVHQKKSLKNHRVTLSVLEAHNKTLFDAILIN